MSRQDKRRRRRRRKARKICAWALLILAELVAAAIPAGILSAVLVPICRAARGDRAMSVEWFIVGPLFIGAYTAIHCFVCNKLEEG